MTNPLDALTHHCTRCKHTWIRRTAHDPKMCPKCKTVCWNKPRVRKIQPERMAAIRGKAKAQPGARTEGAQPVSHDRRPSPRSGSVRHDAAVGANRKGKTGTTRGEKR